MMPDANEEWAKVKNALDGLKPDDMLVGVVNVLEEIESKAQQGDDAMDNEDLTASVYVLGRALRYLLERDGVVAEEEASTPAGG